MEDGKDIIPEKTGKKKYFKYLFRIFLYIIIGIIGFNAVLYILLSIPPFQNFIAGFALSKIKPLVKTEISINKVRLSLFNHVNLQGVYIESLEKDTLLYAGNIDVGLNIWKLIDGELQIKSVGLDNTLLNISQDSIDSPYNFQFLIDAFASNDTTTSESQSDLKISIENIEISNTRINYNVLSEPSTPGVFNASHISIKDLNTKLSLNSIDILNLDANIRTISFTEQSGLKVKNAEGHILSKGGILQSKEIALALSKSELNISDFNYNLFNKKLSGKINLNISPLDASVFMPELKELENNIQLSSDFSGILPFFSVDNFSINYGEDFALGANASISDYTNFHKSNLKLHIDKFKITSKAITQFAQIGDSTYTSPEALSSIEYLRLKGNLQGNLKNLKLDAETWTNAGSIQLFGNVSADTAFSDFKIDADIKTQNLNLAPFIGKAAELGRINMQTNIKIASIKNLSAQINGLIDGIEYQNNTLRNIRFKGEYNSKKIGGWVDANLPIGKLRGEVSMNQNKNKEIDFDINLQDLLVDYFYKNPNWKNPKLSLCLNGKLKGSDIDNIEGFIYVDSLMFRDNTFNFQPGKILLQSGTNKDKERHINFDSSILKAKLTGKYSFTDLNDEIINLMHSYLPAFFDENKRVKTNKNNFDLNISIENTELLNDFFQLPVNIIEPATISATINTVEKSIKLNANIPHIRYNDTEIKEAKLKIGNTKTALDTKLSLSLPQQDKTPIDLNIGIGIKSDSINTLLSVKNNDNKFKIDGLVKILANFQKSNDEVISNINFLPTNLDIGELKFSILPANIIYKEDETSISNFGIALNNQKYFGIEGIVSKYPKDIVKVYFNKAKIDDILNAFDINGIKAELNGEILLSNMLNDPEFRTKQLIMNDIIVFGDSLGTLNINSSFSTLEEVVKFSASLNSQTANSKINGLFFTTKDSLNANINLDRLSLKWLKPFTEGTLSQVSGSISSNIDIEGSLSLPRTRGWLGFNNLNIGVDYTNVTYKISDTIKVLPDKIGFRDLAIYDNYNNKATASALVSHKNFENFEFLLNLDMNNFLVLNTENRTDSLFYGKLIMDGNAKIKGNTDNVSLKLNIKNNKNSNLNIVIPQVSEASSYESIVYINTPSIDSADIVKTEQTSVTFPLDLGMGLTLTPDITLGVLINPVTGDAMQMKGSAQINFDYNLGTQNMKAFGDYTLTDGFVKLKIQNLKTLIFNIKEGSQVSFSGNPMQATFNITAYHRLRASLASLDPGFSNSKVNVDCILKIKGNIQKMELSYDISLPDSNEDIQQKIKSLINTDEQKIRQFAYLIATNTFYSNTVTGNNIGNAIGTSVVSGLLSQSLDALLGSVLGSKFEIGTDISSEDGSFSNVDMRVNVSTRIFDDKLKLNTNLGYRTDQTANTDNNQFIGDFDVEYDLTKNIKLKAFNRTNDRIYRQAETTQGIGIVYTKEAKKIKGLFRLFKKKNKKKNDDKKESKKP